MNHHRRTRFGAIAVAAMVSAAVWMALPGTASQASPGDPLTSYGDDGVVTIKPPAPCSTCPTTTSPSSDLRLTTSGTRAILGYGFTNPATATDRGVTGAGIAVSDGGAAPWRAEIGDADPTTDHRVLAVGATSSTGSIVAVVAITKRGIVDTDASIAVGQELRRFDAGTGAPVSTVTLPAASAGAWTRADVAADGSVVGIAEDLAADGRPMDIVRRYDAAGSLRWSKALPAGDGIDDLAVDGSGRITLAGSRARSAPGGVEAFDGLVVRLDDTGALVPTFGSSGVLLSPAPAGFGRGFVAVDGDGSSTVVVGRDQELATDDDDSDLEAGALVLLRFESGQLDPAFSGDGVVERRWNAAERTRYLPDDVTLDGDRLVVSGSQDQADGSAPEASLVRYTAAGAEDPDFAIDGRGRGGYDQVSTVPDGYLAVGPAEVVDGGWALQLRAFASSGPRGEGPAAPTGLSITGAGAQRLDLGWSPADGQPDAYDVIVDLDGDGEPELTSTGPAVAGGPVKGLPGGRTVALAVRARNAHGIGPRTPWTPLAVPPFTTLDAFTNAQYRDFAGRAATASERAAWRTALTNRTLDPATAILQINDGAYWAPKQAPVIRLFQAYFLRLPDKGGLDYWTSKFRSGTTLAQISSGFAGSSEFKARYGALSNRQFVERIYQNVLGRAGEPSGVAYWTSQLDQKRKNRGQVMVGFSEAAEYKTKTANVVDAVDLYAGMLRRMPTALEVEQWQADRSAGAPRRALPSSILETAAYDGRNP